MLVSGREKGLRMSSKRQQTMAKRARELKVKERRARKLEKKHAAAAARKADDETTPGGTTD
jgi:hypothetical protein